ncbi:barstar family protein [Brevundimonas viscosa]|uniref:Barstar (Barnase inhibitor) n=1 Tax=Brevundimonas viscosa TaxID=871741 RepID=A0A1I6QGT7_9CAUL|nr:barstar family protein [Brevundimonas viscosa]SFS51687.1 Barstar (barnase inhibitor) [Brevundimonas viscosa]
MNTTLIDLPAKRIVDWATFHDVFADVLGLPAFYGRNMNAWIDCMTDADDPDTGMVRAAVQPGQLMTLQIDDAADFARRCPEQFNALIECTAFVNYRRMEAGGTPVLSLLLSGNLSAMR